MHLPAVKLQTNPFHGFTFGQDFHLWLRFSPLVVIFTFGYDFHLRLRFSPLVAIFTFGYDFHLWLRFSSLVAIFIFGCDFHLWLRFSHLVRIFTFGCDFHGCSIPDSALFLPQLKTFVTIELQRQFNLRPVAEDPA